MSLISYSIAKYIVFQRFDNIKLFHHKESSIASWSSSSSLYQIHTWKLSVNGKIFAHRKIQNGRKSLVEKKKQKKTKQNKKNTGPKKKERVSFWCGASCLRTFMS